ncbi:hypothetical protein CORC01_09845 [Colletotrichum orchidophilum]|uniref:Uncharacterized protein n=1 Tax=Colletotrichum orchidophilum TaxID=1209926 RepID=A0A1G4B0B7_9PEZI|nr:uncharacterized protein CORC01_09845 [Colletotrichum orchidophilum]OHE94827.1 hypothetical protein CORC01_09845 [Colletotrichum orchidophilum]
MYINYVFILAAFAPLQGLAVPTVLTDEPAWTPVNAHVDGDAVAEEIVNSFIKGLDFGVAKTEPRAAAPPTVPGSSQPGDPKESKPKGSVPPSGPSTEKSPVECKDDSECSTEVNKAYKAQVAAIAATVSTRRKLHPFCAKGKGEDECSKCVNREAVVLAGAEVLCAGAALATHILTGGIGTPAVISQLVTCMSAAAGVFGSGIAACDKP